MFRLWTEPSFASSSRMCLSALGAIRRVRRLVIVMEKRNFNCSSGYTAVGCLCVWHCAVTACGYSLYGYSVVQSLYGSTVRLPCTVPTVCWQPSLPECKQTGRTFKNALWANIKSEASASSLDPVNATARAKLISNSIRVPLVNFDELKFWAFSSVCPSIYQTSRSLQTLSRMLEPLSEIRWSPLRSTEILWDPLRSSETHTDSPCINSDF